MSPYLNVTSRVLLLVAIAGCAEQATRARGGGRCICNSGYRDGSSAGRFGTSNA